MIRFVVLQGVGEFVVTVGRLDRIGRQNKQKVIAALDTVINFLLKVGAASNTLLVKPGGILP